MPVPPEASPLAQLEPSIAASRPDRAAEAALHALRAGVVARDILGAAAKAAASRYNPASGLAPHGLAALAAASELGSVLEPRHQALAVLQAVSLAASESKLGNPQPPAPTVTGEVTHLGRSALLAFRAGDLRDAESVFLGIVDERGERRMAGEVLFRASLEDPGEVGHKLLTSVAAWRLARALGFRDGRTLVRPAVQYLVQGAPERRGHDAMMSLLGKEWVDLDSLVSGGRPLDDAGRGRLATSLATPSEEACLASVLDLLRGGYAATALSEGIALEAALRLLAAEGYRPELAHALLVVRAADFVLDFSRSSERIYALFQAALRARSPAPQLSSAKVHETADEAEALHAVAEDVASRRPHEAAARVRAYLSAGHPAKPLVSLLAYHACRDSTQANQGHNLLLAQACVEAHAATHAPEFLMALAKSVAASPKDLTASKAWADALGL